MWWLYGHCWSRYANISGGAIFFLNVFKKTFYSIQMNFIQKLVERRVKVLPITDTLSGAFAGVGALFGGSYGFSQSLHEGDGVVWRPTVGAMCGGAIGFTMGLFPYQTFGLVVAVDAGYTFFSSRKKP